MLTFIAWPATSPKRLLKVAREQAAAQGLDATFALGEAAPLPLEGGEADVVLSVFGVIFASNAPVAAAEIARVTAPAGRILLSAWVPEGAIHDAVRVAQEAVRNAVGAPPGPPPFAWHDRDALAELFAPHGFDVTVEEENLAFTANSPRDYLDAESANHPHALDLRSGQRGSGRLPREEPLHRGDPSAPVGARFVVRMTAEIRVARRRFGPRAAGRTHYHNHVRTSPALVPAEMDEPD